jgi:putative endonuclease
MYILECNNGKYYTGSTKNLDKRMVEHWTGSGSNYTRKHKPLMLVYSEEFAIIDQAFYREKQVQNWSHKKKKSLIEGDLQCLHDLAGCKNESNAVNRPLDSARGPMERGARGPMENDVRDQIRDGAKRPKS